MKVTRREVLAAAIAGTMLSKLDSAETESDLRKVERQTSSGWERVRMIELKKGEIFRIHCQEDPIVHLKPYRAVSDGYWCDRHGKTLQAMVEKKNAGIQAEPV